MSSTCTSHSEAKGIACVCFSQFLDPTFTCLFLCLFRNVRNGADGFFFNVVNNLYLMCSILEMLICAA